MQSAVELQDIVDYRFEVRNKQKAVQGGYTTPERGIATILLPHVDVPQYSGLACYHSVLVSGGLPCWACSLG